jgi:hypothetical protein
MNTPTRRLRAQSTLPSPPDNHLVTHHQAFIRALPCLSCGKPAPSECAYVGMLPGLGIPPSERYLLPLCGPEAIWKDCCHSRKHYRGAARFWLELGVDPLDLASQLWRVSDDARARQSTVMRARQAAMPRVSTENSKTQRKVHGAPRSIGVRVFGMDFCRLR